MWYKQLLAQPNSAIMNLLLQIIYIIQYISTAYLILLNNHQGNLGSKEIALDIVRGLLILCICSWFQFTLVLF